MPVVDVTSVPFDHPVVRGLLDEWHAELGEVIRGGSTVTAGDFAPPVGVFLVAHLDATPAGFAGLRQLAATTGEVKRVFVRPTARRQGIGRLLLAEIEQRARERDLRELRLDTRGDEPAALALFRSAGFQPTTDYNGNPLARHWFVKRLGTDG